MKNYYFFDHQFWHSSNFQVFSWSQRILRVLLPKFYLDSKIKFSRLLNIWRPLCFFFLDLLKVSRKPEREIFSTSFLGLETLFYSRRELMPIEMIKNGRFWDILQILRKAFRLFSSKVLTAWIGIGGLKYNFDVLKWFIMTTPFLL